MKLKFVTAIALCAMAILSCDEDTGTLGDSLTDEGNKLVQSLYCEEAEKWHYTVKK